MNLPNNPSSSTKRVNPHLYPQELLDRMNAGPAWLRDKILKDIRQAKRIRQERKPNKLEQEWATYLRSKTAPEGVIREQSLRLRLANGAWYKPDVTQHWPLSGISAYEVKGPKGMKGQSKGFLALKMAASMWPEIRFYLVWKVNGAWHEQFIQP